MNSDKLWTIPASFELQTDPRKREQLQLQRLKELGVDELQFHQRLQMNSRFVQTHRDVSMEHRNVALHSHEFYEILCCASTCGMEYLVGTERYRLRRGDIILVTPGISHRPIFPETLPEPYIRYVFWMSREFVERMHPMFAGYSLERDLKTSLLRTSGTRWEYLESMFLAGVQESEQRGPYWEAAVLGNSVSLLTHLIRAVQSGGAETLPAEEPELVDQILSYAEQHLAEKITLADMARVFYVSESTISQTFRKKMGSSFYKSITQRRLIAAKALIAQGVPLESINEQVGFSDYSSFYRAFKQEYGISPRQYRTLLDK